jgi:biotin carboxyl carrier protein
MELSDIRQLALLMKEAGIKRLDYTAGDARIVLEREGGETPAAAEPAAQTTCASAESGHAAANLYTVTSPMVGVFYAAPAPDEPPFVSIGDKVEPGDTLCITKS